MMKTAYNQGVAAAFESFKFAAMPHSLPSRALGAVKNFGAGQAESYGNIARGIGEKLQGNEYAAAGGPGFNADILNAGKTLIPGLAAAGGGAYLLGRDKEESKMDHFKAMLGLR